jgi:cytochrome P450
LTNQRRRPNALQDYLTPIVENALQKKKAVDRGEKTVSAELGGEDGHSLLDALFQESDSIAFVQNELLNILLAARDTTAALLTFTYIRLS